jgi:capsular exopolysaccharide synthesis family protein
LNEKKFKVLTVCSAIAREGKTTIVSNLAVAMARKGLKVALIDADMRISQVHDVFRLSNATGLSNVLQGESPMIEEPAGYMQPTQVENLFVLPAGPTPEMPGQLLESKAMGELLQAMRENYDIVLIDTPPITNVGDTLCLGRLVDSNLMVIGSGLSNRRTATWAKQLLTNVRADICGSILNFTRARQGSAYYYYYYADSKGVRNGNGNGNGHA